MAKFEGLIQIVSETERVTVKLIQNLLANFFSSIRISRNHFGFISTLNIGN